MDGLPIEIQNAARHRFALLKRNPAHPSLCLKKISGVREDYWSVRIGPRYRALGVSVPDGIQWFWIGSHAQYDRLIG